MSQKRVASVRIVWLQAFLAVAEHGTMKACEEVVGVSQSQISRYLEKLDEYVGRPLWTGDVPSTLNSEGERFRPVAQEIVDHLAEWQAPHLKSD